MKNHYRLTIVNLILANFAIITYPLTIAISAIFMAIVTYIKSGKPILMALLILTSIISLILGELLQPVSLSWLPWHYTINVDNLKFAFVIIPVPFIVNLFFINSFFE